MQQGLEHGGGEELAVPVPLGARRPRWVLVNAVRWWLGSASSQSSSRGTVCQGNSLAVQLLARRCHERSVRGHTAAAGKKNTRRSAHLLHPSTEKKTQKNTQNPTNTTKTA